MLLCVLLRRQSRQSRRRRLRALLTFEKAKKKKKKKKKKDCVKEYLCGSRKKNFLPKHTHKKKACVFRVSVVGTKKGSTTLFSLLLLLFLLFSLFFFFFSFWRETMWTTL